MHSVQLEYFARYRQDELLREAARDHLAAAAALAARRQVPPREPRESLRPG